MRVCVCVYHTYLIFNVGFHENLKPRGDLVWNPVFTSCSSVALDTFLNFFESRFQKNLNSQNNLEKEQHSWRNNAPWLHTTLQSYSDQNSMALAQKQTYRSIEQDKKPINKPTHIWSINLWQRRQEYSMEKRQSLQ